MGSKATCTVFCSTFLSLGCLKSRTFRCMSASRESKSKGNLTRIRGTEYLIRMVDPSGLTKLTGYIRVNTLRLILVTAARLALSCRLCSAKGNALKYCKSCMQLFEKRLWKVQIVITNYGTIAFGCFEEYCSSSSLKMAKTYQILLTGSRLCFHRFFQQFLDGRSHISIWWDFW